jgi:Flp pilus assembly protein TadD
VGSDAAAVWDPLGVRRRQEATSTRGRGRAKEFKMKIPVLVAHAIVVLSMAARGLLAQPALLPGEAGRGASCMGPAEISSHPVEPSREVTIAVFADTLNTGDIEEFRRQVSSFFQGLKGANPVRLALMVGNQIQFAGPFETRADLQQALGEIAAGTPGAEASSPEHFYTALGMAAQQLGSNWSRAVLAGRFPAPSAEIAKFTEAWLSGKLRSAKLRVSYWSPSDDKAEVLDAVAPSTGGDRLADGLKPFAAELRRKQDLWEVSWRDPAAASGFRACPVSLWLAGEEGPASVVVPTLLVPAGASLPDPEHYALLLEKIRSLSALLKQPKLTPEQAVLAEADLNAALEINPRDGEALRLGADLYTRKANDAKLSAVLAMLVEMAPNEAALFAALGHTRYRLGDADGADRALLRARELKLADAAVCEELARIRLARKDDRGALGFLEESLAARNGNQDLWLLRADVATRLSDWRRSIDSLEHAVALGAVPMGRRIVLTRLYIEHEQPDRALVEVRAVGPELPPDAAVRSEFAGFLDKVKQSDEALAAWKRVLQADPKLETAHVRVTELLLAKNALPEALEAADTGLQAAPRSARLYLAKAEVLEKQDRFYDARRTLRQAAASVPDAALLAHLAGMEDAGGEHAARYYRQALEAAGDTGGEGADLRKTAVERGLEASLRDSDLENAAWFRSRLENGAKGSAALRVRGGTIAIPGGLAALSFVAHNRESSPDRFLVEYARTLASNLRGAAKPQAEAYINAIRNHFRRIADLAALGAAKDGKMIVTISLQDKKQAKTGEKVLDLLGWKAHTSHDGVKVEPAEKGARATHEETASALAIDEIGMQEKLQSGQPFSFEIPFENANVVLGEEAWKTQFYPKEKYAGGLAEVLATDLRLAQTYAALGQMDADSAATLVAAVPLRTISEKYAPLLLQYSSALAVERGRAVAPGGPAADPIWTKLVGASPGRPGPFFSALLGKDDGKMLGFYGALSTLDIQHQRFFTRTPSRTGKFYELYKDAPEMRRATSREIPSGAFEEFLAEVPLDEDGTVDFPGSAEVWMVAKGQSHSTGDMAKMLKRLKRAVAPDVEDEILLRLAGTRYKQSGMDRAELDNFLAVVRIDAHRSDPLDEASALLLAQHYAEDGAAYPFFSTLTGLGQKQFEQFFALSEALRARPEAERMDQLASLNSLIEIVCLAQQAGTLDEAKAADLFQRIVTGLQAATSPAQRTVASLDLARQLLAQAGIDASDPDRAMRTLVLGSYPGANVELDGETVAVDASKARHARFQQVIELQKAPLFATVLALSDAARNLSAGKGTPADLIGVLDSKAGSLMHLDVPKDAKSTSDERTRIEGFRPRRLQEIVKQLREKTAKKKVNPKDLEKLSLDYLDEMDGPVRWSLESVVYAYFLNPADLLVSEDALLLRKQEFIALKPGRGKPVWELAELAQSSEKAGSYFIGGFANFADAAGAAAAKSAKLGGDNGDGIASKQMAALRMTDWGRLRDEDLRLLGLRVTVAREWVVHAASQPELEGSLSESALGLISLTRRAALFTALAEGNWKSVWETLTLSDLYFLGGRYLERYQKDAWQSPATHALRELAARNDGRRLELLGGDFGDTLGCSHPHLRIAPPYEEYEKELLPNRLAERTAEFKLYLAKYADAEGIPAAAMGALAEPAARAILKNLQMSDVHDWRSVLTAFAALDSKAVEGGLAK